MACREPSRRAISFLEITIVLAIAGLLAVASITRYGHNAISNGNAEGVARKLALSLVHARRSTIAMGDNHYLQLTTSGGNVTSYAMIRRASGGDTQVDQTWTIPADVTVTTGATTLEFDFEGSALAAYSVTVAGLDKSWNVSVVMLTGAIQVTEIP